MVEPPNLLGDSIRNRTVPPYHGPGRIPASDISRPIGSAIHTFWFGSAINPRTRLIDKYSKALEVLHSFAIEGKDYEIIFCTDQPHLSKAVHQTAPLKFLGIDVIDLDQGYYSIIQDFPLAEWAEIFLEDLNSNGLFSTRPVAEHFIKEYNAHDSHQDSKIWPIIYVYQVG